jgi:hypothetical protein
MEIVFLEGMAVEPYRAPPSLAHSTDPWAGARLGVLMVGIAGIVRTLACLVEWAGLRVATVDLSGVELPRGTGLFSAAMLTYAAAACALPFGVLAFRRSVHSRSFRAIALAAALLLGVERSADCSSRPRG